MAASAFMEYREYRDKEDDQEPTLEGPYLLCEDVFQFSYNEDKQVVSQRFQEWLNDAVLAGLDQWRRQL
ncbi:MAG TPA: hypothetical protein VGB26_02290 [Nitrospiria bacterium]|jgi:hypothetical protein